MSIAFFWKSVAILWPPNSKKLKGTTSLHPLYYPPRRQYHELNAALKNGQLARSRSKARKKGERQREKGRTKELREEKDTKDGELTSLSSPTDESVSGGDESHTKSKSKPPLSPFY